MYVCYSLGNNGNAYVHTPFEVSFYVTAGGVESLVATVEVTDDFPAAAFNGVST